MVPLGAMHKGRLKPMMKVLLGVVLGGLLLMGGCALLLTGAVNEADKAITESTQRQDDTDQSSQEKQQESGPDLTVSQENAVGAAENYLDTAPFSESGLIKQLKFEGYSTKDAAFVVESLNIDYNEQAAKAAANYLDTQSFSRQGLIQQLKFEGYTAEQAAYGVKKTGL